MTGSGAFSVAMMGAIVGALVGGAISLGVQRWRYSVDQWSSRTTEFCADIVKLADVASEFWLKERKKDELAAELIRVRGGIARLEALQVPFQYWCNRDHAITLEKRVGRFVSAISGGDFMKPVRKADLDRAMEVQATAAALISHLHDCRAAASSIRASVARMALRRLDGTVKR
jgi:hypothetical protein